MLRMVALLLLLSGCSTMQESGIDTLMRDYSGAVPGASVLVLRDGEVVFAKGYGLADLTTGTKTTPDSHYRLASITKQFTAAAILTLRDRGALRLDDPVRKFLPALPSAAGGITIEHLLTHTSGLAGYEDLLPSDAAVQIKDAGVLQLLAAHPTLEFEPGSKYAYSNSGYALLALIVEKVTGQSFARFLAGSVFRPNGMTTSVAHEEGSSVVSHRAFGHSRDGASWHRDDQSLTSAVLGDGGIYSSVRELASWLRALDSGRFADASTPRVDTHAGGIRYGYGFRIHEHRGRRIVTHTGETRGFRNALVRFPDQRLAVVVLTNRNEGAVLPLALAIADRFVESAPAP